MQKRFRWKETVFPNDDGSDCLLFYANSTSGLGLSTKAAGSSGCRAEITFYHRAKFTYVHQAWSPQTFNILMHSFLSGVAVYRTQIRPASQPQFYAQTFD